MRPPLRVGTVYDFRNTPESGMDMPSLYAAIMDRVAMLDGLGLDLVWFTEHHFLDDGYHVQALLPKFREMAAEAGRDPCVGADHDLGRQGEPRSAQARPRRRRLTRGGQLQFRQGRYDPAGTRPLGDVDPPAWQLRTLDERQDLGLEFLHAAEDFVGCRTAETEIEAADTDVAQRPDVGGDERRRTGEQAVFAITGLRLARSRRTP